MPPESESAMDRARSASGDELNLLLHEAPEEVLLALLQNPHLDDTRVTILLERLDLSANVIEAIAEGGKWSGNEGVRLRLARHPRTPKRFAIAAVRQLYLFDLVRLTLLPSAPADIRRLAEEIILTRIPHLPIGEKLTLARRGPARVAGALLAEGHPEALKLALGNSFLTESQILKVLAKPGAPARVVVAIAQHPKWSCQYNVRVALVRNTHTPGHLVKAFLPDLTVRDLKDVGGMEGLPVQSKKFIRQELDRRTGAPRGAEI